MPGISTVESWEPNEIRGPGDSSQFLAIPCTIEEGQDLDKGTIIGKRTATDEYIAYNITATAASATTNTADAGNTGNATSSAVEVQDDYTLTEDWTLTASDATTFAVVGSVTGAAGDLTLGSEFKFPDTTAYKIKLTMTAGVTPCVEGDFYTFSTTASTEDADVAEGILGEDVDATDGAIVSHMYVKGSFIESELTGLDSDAKTHLNGKSVGDYFVI